MHENPRPSAKNRQPAAGPTPARSLHIAYLLKMYPRFSETFIVNEMLAHEAVGTRITIYSLRPPVDGRFHATYAQVQGEVHYVPDGDMRHTLFWHALHDAAARYPQLWSALQENPHLGAREIVQAIWLADALTQIGQRPDCIHAHFGSIATSVAWLVNRLTGIPYVFTAHAKDIYQEEVIAEDLRRKMRDAQHVITVSDFNVKYLTGSIGVAPAKVKRVYNGLDLDSFPYTSPRVRPRRLVAVGRLVEKKGFDVLVAACALLAAADTPIPCEIIGAGPLEADLRAQIETLGVGEWVTLRGPQPQHIVKAAVQKAAGFVAPCVVGSDGNRDGLPTVLLEAMALGTPTISTDVTGIPEILVHEQSGLMVAQHDAAGLAAAMLRLVEDGELRAQLAEAARARIEVDFDIQRNAAQIRKLYHAADPWRTKSSPKLTRKRAQTQPPARLDPVPDSARVPVGAQV